MAGIETSLTLLPQCVQAGAIKGITASGCGQDIACICTDDTLTAVLEQTLLQQCSPVDRDRRVSPAHFHEYLQRPRLTEETVTLSLAKELCTSAVPSLNDSRQREIIGVMAVLIALATFAVAFRVIARKLSTKAFGVDDILILIALIITYGLNALNLYSLKNGYGKHMITLTEVQIIRFAKADIATQILFATSITLTKLSLLFFYYRIFPIRRFTILSIITGCIMIGWWISLVMATLLQCRPLAYFWDKAIDNGYCINENSFAYGITAANVVTDIVVLILPIPWLWGLRLAPRKRLAIIGIFVLGSFVCISGLIRIPLLHELDPIDETWTIVPSGLWINVEANIGLLSACLPVMRPLFKSSTHFFSSRSKSKSSSISGKEKREMSKESALSSASTKYGSEWGGNGNGNVGAETRNAYVGTEIASSQKPTWTYRGSVEHYPRSTPPPPPDAQQPPPRHQPRQSRHQKSWYGRPLHRQIGDDGWRPPWDEREIQRRETGRIEAILPPGVLDLRDRARRWGREASF